MVIVPAEERQQVVSAEADDDVAGDNSAADVEDTQ
jgi:hypothetical protein